MLKIFIRHFSLPQFYLKTLNNQLEFWVVFLLFLCALMMKDKTIYNG